MTTVATIDQILAHKDRSSYATVASHSVVREVTRLLDPTAPPTVPQETHHRRSITEIQGLGQEIWKGVDAGEYISRLRDEWDNR